MRIFLTGFMAAGKSYYGELLSEKLDTSFIDLDKVIEKESSKSINKIFAKEGEKKFREIEQKLLRKTISSNKNFIMACGGGIFELKENIIYMQQTGVIVFIDPDIETIIERLEKEKQKRPLLKYKKGEKLESFIKETHHKRLTMYRKADIVFKPEKDDLDVLVKKIRMFLY